jgi:hypothetical protein
MIEGIGFVGTRFVAVVLTVKAKRANAALSLSPENVCASLDNAQPAFPIVIQPIDLGTSRLEAQPFMAVGMDKGSERLALDRAFGGSIVFDGGMGYFGHAPLKQKAHGLVKAIESMGAGVGNFPALVLSPQTVYRLALTENGSASLAMIFAMQQHRLSELHVRGHKIHLPPLPRIESGSLPSQAPPLERWSYGDTFSISALPGFSHGSETKREKIYTDRVGSTVAISGIHLTSGAANKNVARGVELVQSEFEAFAKQAVNDFAGRILKPVSTRHLPSGDAVVALPVEAQSSSVPRYTLQYGAVSRSGLIVLLHVRGVGSGADAVANVDHVFQSANFSK